MGKKEEARLNATSKLLRYLYTYESKRFDMNHVIIGIKDHLNRTGSLTKGQFDVLVPFLRREREFAGMDEHDLRNQFDPIVGKTNRKKVYDGASLLGL